MIQTPCQTDFFPSAFEQLTEKLPMRWQERLFQDCLDKNKIPAVIDLPTGLGKTMVMAIWLIARAVNKEFPRRLIYVVDRRTVVDQATTLAIKFQRRIQALHRLARRRPELGQLCTSFPVPAISTLRGQRADNRDWALDPSRPAIIIGTVDMIGSRLLFSGYRSSYKQRPLDAGLLGQDSLLVLDEAHLSKPFEKLVKSITGFQSNRGSPLRVIRMTATSTETNETPSEKIFRLRTDPASPIYDLYPDPDPKTGEERNQIITRYRATKCLRIEEVVESRKQNDALARAAIKIASDGTLVGKRIVIFVRSPEDAKEIAKIIKGHDKPSKSKSNPDPKGQYADSVELLTGTMRGLERDVLVEKLVFKNRWLNGELDPSDSANEQPVFLVSTSAGEVGFDLNADHLVGDDAPLDSWIQRLGRVNRRGTGNATVILIRQEKVAKNDFDKACIATSKLFTDRLDLITDRMDVSPKALDALKKTLAPERIKEASTPEPTMVELTDILLDAWSMTSITERMPGRPEVGPWLRGIADNLPQTTIAWRAELDLPGFDQLDLEDIEEWYDTHSIRTHETLSVPMSVAANWFEERWDNLDDGQRAVMGARPIIVDRAGLKFITVSRLLEQLAHKNLDSILNAQLIVPASFGGIERGVGLLDPTAPQSPAEETDADEETRRVDASSDVADERGRFRELVTTNEAGRIVTPIGSGTKPADASRFVLELESGDDTSVQLFSYIPKREKPEWGSKRQTLSEHVDLVRKRLDEILSRLDIADPLKRAAKLAAEYHDHGKNRERWQRTVNGEATPPGKEWTDKTIGKSGGAMRRDARHYRHEFGSIREFIDAQIGVTFTDSKGTDITQEVIDLALHLIAVHHGRGRPHFPKGGFDPDAERRSAEIHADVIRRFAHLQRKYGWWYLAWLENLLRCADALASGGGE